MKAISFLGPVLPGLCLLLLATSARPQDVPLYKGIGTTESKTQSKLWHHDGTWWCALADGADGYIYRYDGTEFIKQPDLLTTTKVSGRADVFPSGDDLYILIGHSSQSELLRYRYNHTTSHYDLQSGFPVSISLAGGWENAVLSVDSTGRAWIGYTDNSTVYVMWSTSSDYTSWDKRSFISGINQVDICSVTPFDGKIGLMWSDQERDNFCFVYHDDGAAPSSWSGIETIVQGGGIAEDHINLAVTPNGTVLASTKNHDDTVNLYVRDPISGWDGPIEVTTRATRPIVVYDEDNDYVYVFFTDISPSSYTINVKKAPLAQAYLLTTNPELVYLDESASLNDCTSTKQTVTRDTGLIVMAQGDGYAHYHDLTIGTEDPTSGGGTSGGDTSGGDTSGGDTSGGDTSGGDTSGGDAGPLPGGIVRINFQTSSTGTPPPGHLADTGAPFDTTRGYGWDSSVQTKQRDHVPELWFDTFAYVSNPTAATWEYALPNGEYTVDLIAGSPEFTAVHYVSVEGVRLIDGIATVGHQIVKITGHTVTVTDQRLSVTIGGAGNDGKTKICTLAIHEGGSAPSAETIEFLDLPHVPHGLEAPQVSALSTPGEGQAPLLVQFAGSANSPQGAIVSYEWDFGDEGTASVQNPEHTYTTPGDYTAKLTVVDEAGAGVYTTVVVHVLGGTSAQPSVASTLGTTPFTAAFTGAGTTNNGIIEEYFWDFGDGATSTGQSPAHTYTSEGTYVAKLTVTDTAGVSASAIVTIVVVDPATEPTPQPSPGPAIGTIQINFQPSSAQVPEGYTADTGELFSESLGFGWTANLDNEERNHNDDKRLDTFVEVPNSTTETWEYVVPNGDYRVTLVAGSPMFSGIHTVQLEGATIIEGVATKAEFVEVNDFPVTIADGRLTIVCGGGGSKKTKLCYLIIESAGGGTTTTTEPEPCITTPTATAQASTTLGSAPLAVSFTGTGTSACGDMASYAWSFGDGATSAAQNPAHVFTSAGTYTVTLTVTDAQGNTGQATLVVAALGDAQASASATPTSGTVPLDVAFTGGGSSANGSIATWAWEFDDGTISALQNPSHTYTSAGTFTARLTVTDSVGVTASDTVSIVVSEATPSDPGPGAGTVLARINFQDPAAATPDGYLPDSGDTYSASRGYGWDQSLSDNERNFNDDKRLDTYVQFPNSDGQAKWEFDLDNGNYKVTLVAGSPQFNGIQTVAIEGTTVMNQVATSQSFVEVTDHAVTINDGKLTITVGGGSSKKTKLCYLIITRA